MKSLKLALALALTSTSGAALAQQTPAVAPLTAAAAQGLCEAFKINHGKDCTTSQQTAVTAVFDRFSKMPAVTSQEESAARQVAIIDALAQTFGMTREQFLNPPGMAERRAAAELDERANQFCEGFEIDHARPCTTQEKTAIRALIAEFSSPENKQTREERIARLARVFGMTSEQFQNAPDKGARRFAAARCVEAKEALNVTCSDTQRRQLQEIFKADAAQKAPTTAQEAQQRMLNLINAVRQVFGMEAVQPAPATAPASGRTPSTLNIA